MLPGTRRSRVKKVSQPYPSADEPVERDALDDAAQDRGQEARDVTATFRVVDGPEQARPQGDLDRVVVPAPGRVASERKDELLAGRVQAARGAVEAVEDDALNRCVDAA